LETEPATVASYDNTNYLGQPLPSFPLSNEQTHSHVQTHTHRYTLTYTYTCAHTHTLQRKALLSVRPFSPLKKNHAVAFNSALMPTHNFRSHRHPFKLLLNPISGILKIKTRLLKIVHKMATAHEKQFCLHRLHYACQATPPPPPPTINTISVNMQERHTVLIRAVQSGTALRKHTYIMRTSECELFFGVGGRVTG